MLHKSHINRTTQYLPWRVQVAQCKWGTVMSGATKTFDVHRVWWGMQFQKIVSQIGQSPLGNFLHKHLLLQALLFGRWGNFAPRLLQLVLLVRPGESKMLLYGRVEILEVRTTVNIFIGSPKKISCKMMMAFSVKDLSKCLHTTASNAESCIYWHWWQMEAARSLQFILSGL